MIQQIRAELFRDRGFEMATCVLHGGPVDGGGSDRVPMVVPGLAPEYISVDVNEDGDEEEVVFYRRATECAGAWATPKPVWHYEYDEAATRDPTCIERR